MIKQLLFFVIFTTTSFASSSMYDCLQDENCKSILSQEYGKKLTTVVAAWKKGLLKKINSVENFLFNSQEDNNYYFYSEAVDKLQLFVTSQCKCIIKPYNQFPFYYEYSGSTEADGKYSNMNCFLVEANQFSILEQCIQTQYFNIYDKTNQQSVDKVICFKMQNTVYDAFVEIAKNDLILESGQKDIKNLFKELPRYGTSLINSCMPNCRVCSSYDQCSQCQNQYSKINDECQQCHSTCLTCSSKENQSSCLSCQPNLGLFKNECLATCPSGYINLDGICKACDKGCKACSKLTYNCIECFDGFIQQENTCKSKCENGFYYDSSSNKCKTCQIGCINCLNDQFCYDCDKQYFKEEWKCVSQCQNNYINILGVCTKCSNNCIGCVDKTNKCLQCSQGLFMQNGVCVLECKDGYYGDKNERKCYKCNEACGLCRGPKQSDCISCGIDTCIQQFFNPYKSIMEVKCIISSTQDCQICGDEGACLKCKDPKILINNQENQSCIDKCPGGYDQNGQTCENQSSEQGLQKWVISIIVISLCMVCLIIVFAICLYCRKKKIGFWVKHQIQHINQELKQYPNYPIYPLQQQSIKQQFPELQTQQKNLESQLDKEQQLAKQLSLSQNKIDMQNVFCEGIPINSVEILPKQN